MSRLERVSPDQPDVAELLTAHLQLMRAQTPAESCHALDPDALAGPQIALYCLRQDGRAVAVGAIQTQDNWGELKSMHTRHALRGRGIGRRLLIGLIEEARVRAPTGLRLETGSGSEHAAARALYASEGFTPCPPFGAYAPDPLSTFMQRAL